MTQINEAVKIGGIIAIIALFVGLPLLQQIGENKPAEPLFDGGTRKKRSHIGSKKRR
jgi:hypothetical protein